MARIELTMTTGYAAHWGFAEAVREIYQNALDKQTVDPENSMFHTLDEESGILLIGSKNSVLEKSTLLLGHTTKADDEKTIGKFGEGYKLALLVLLRNEFGVKIYNHGAKEVWTPRIVRSKKFKTDVLAIDIEKYILKRVPDHNLVFEITNVWPPNFQMVRETNLNVEPPTDFIQTKYGRILKEEKHRCNVYVSGLYITTIKDEKMKFGYDFIPSVISLDRDRGMVSDFNTFWATSQMWQNSPEPELAAKLLADGCPDVQHFIYNSPAKEVKKVVADNWLNEFGKKAVPVTSQKEAERVQRDHRGYKPVFTNQTHAAIVRSSIPAPTIAKAVSKDREKSPQEHMQRLYNKLRTKVSQAERERLQKLVNLSEQWRWND